jgi:hypothetical protein
MARLRCDATEILSATVFSSPRAGAYRAPIATDIVSSKPTHCSKNLGSKNLGSNNLAALHSSRNFSQFPLCPARLGAMPCVRSRNHTY